MKNNFKIYIVLALFTILAYSSYFNNQFVWDDDWLILDNELIRDFHYIPRIITSELLPKTNYYRPLQTLSYLSDYVIYKLKPFGYHLTNILLHIFNVFLVFLIINLILRQLTNSTLQGRVSKSCSVWLRLSSAECPTLSPSTLLRMLRRMLKHKPRVLVWLRSLFPRTIPSEVEGLEPGASDGLIFKYKIISFITCLFFSVHPIHIEAVGYISGRADLFLALFMLLSLIFYIICYDCSKSKSRYFYLLSVCFFYFALLSKEIAIVFPLILIAYDKIFRKDKNSLLLKKYLPFVGLVLFYTVMRISILNFSSLPIWLSKQSFNLEINVYQRIFIFLKSVLIYLGLLILPLNLHMERRIEFSDSNAPALILYAILAIGLFLLFRKLPEKKRKIIYFGLSWFFIILFPQSSFILPKIMAEHFLYLPSIGVFMIFALGFEQLFVKRKNLTILLLAVIIFFYGFLTFSYSINWKNPVNFYRWTLRYSPQSIRIHQNLGNLYARMGLVEPATVEHKKAMNLNVGVAAEIHYNLGVLYANRGLVDEAEKEYKKAIEIKPNFVEAHNNLGNLYEKKGFFDEALLEYEKVIIIDPKFAKAYYNIGVIYGNQGKLEEAASKWEKALEIDPQYIKAKENIKKAKELLNKNFQ